jgi:hypothetical protein
MMLKEKIMFQKVKAWSKAHERLVLCLSFLLLSIATVYFVYLRNGEFLRGDDYRFHQNRIEGLAASIKNGLFAPTINYYFIGGYGYASSLFYPDFYLYFPALLRVLGVPLVFSFISFAIAINFGTFLITYLAGRYLDLPKRNSYLFSMLYTLSIYRLQDLINRQAIGELLALSFFPLVLAGLYLIKKGAKNRWLILTIAMTGIGLAHFISLEMVSIFIVFYIVANMKAFFKKDAIIALSKAAGLTVLFLSFYLLPVLEQMQHQVFQVTSNPLTLISERSYPLKDVLWNSLKSNVFHGKTANIGTILLVGLVIYTVAMFRKKAQHRDITLITLLLMFMVTNLFPWKLFDQTPLNTIQFPWRFFAIISLLIAYLIAADDLKLFNRRPLLLFGTGLFILVNMYAYQFMCLQTQQHRILTYQQYNKTNSYYIGAGHEYLPEEMDYDYVKAHKDRQLTYNSKEVAIKNQKFQFSSISFDYSVPLNQKAVVTVPFVYYYGYQVEQTVKGKTVSHPAVINPQNGFAEVTVQGQGRATITYQRTAIQKYSAVLSFVSIAGYAFYKIRKTKSFKK